jgi:valyl-tRNA synthetase
VKTYGFKNNTGKTREELESEFEGLTSTAAREKIDELFKNGGLERHEYKHTSLSFPIKLGVTFR